VGCQNRQPALVAVDLVDRPVDDRQPGDQVLPDPIQRMIGSRLLDGTDGQGRPVRELALKKAPHQTVRRLDLTVVHLRGTHETHILGRGRMTQNEEAARRLP